MASLYFATFLVFNAPGKGVPWDDFRKGWLRNKRRRNSAKSFNPLSRAHERYRRQTTDGFAVAKTPTSRLQSRSGKNGQHTLCHTISITRVGLFQISQLFQIILKACGPICIRPSVDDICKHSCISVFKCSFSFSCAQ